MAKTNSSYFNRLAIQDNLTLWSQKLYDKSNEIVLNEQIEGLSDKEKELLYESFSKEDDLEWKKMQVDTTFYIKNAYRELLLNKLKNESK